MRIGYADFASFYCKRTIKRGNARALALSLAQQLFESILVEIAFVKCQEEL